MRGKGEAHQAAGAALEVLWVGEALAAIDELRARGVRVTLCAAARCAEQVAARAPDLLVICGLELAHAEQLTSDVRTLDTGSVPPILVLAPDAARAQAHFRKQQNVVCLALNTPASVLADAVDERLRESASRAAAREVRVAWRELDAWLAKAAREGSSGFLIASDPASAWALGPSGHVAPAPRPAPERAHDEQPRPMTFVEVPERRLHVLREPPARLASKLDLQGASIALVHADAERREAYAKALSDVGAQAEGLEPSQLEGLPSLSPTLVVIGASALDSAAALLADARLASVGWLVVDESRLKGMGPEGIVGPVGALSAPKRSLARRLVDGTLILDRIESFGPAGWLKEVGRSSQPLTLLFKSTGGRGELQLADGKIRGASFVAAGSEKIEAGRAALQATLALRFGKVLVGAHEAVLEREQALAGESAPEGEPLETPAALPEATPASAPNAPNAAPTKATLLTPAPAPKLDRAAATKAAPPTRPATSQAARIPSAESPEPAPTPTGAAPIKAATRERPAPQAARSPSEEPQPAAEAPSPPVAARSARAENLAASAPALPSPLPAPLPAAKPEASEPAPVSESLPSAQSEPSSSAPEPLAARIPERSVPAPAAQQGAAASREPSLPLPDAGPLLVATPEPSVTAPVADQQSALAPQSYSPLPPPASRPLANQDVADAPAAALGRGATVASTPAALASLPPDTASARAPRARFWLGSAACLGVALAAFALLRSPAGGTDHAQSSLVASQRETPALAHEAQTAPKARQVELSNQHVAEPSSASPEERVAEPSTAPSEERVAEPSTAPSEERVAEPSTAPSEERVAEPSTASPEERANEPDVEPTSTTPVATPAVPERAEASEPAALEAKAASPSKIAEAAALFERANRASEASRHAEAEALLTQALALRPDHYAIQYQMALTLVRLRRFEAAHEHLSRAIELNPASPMPWLLQGDAFIQEGKRQKAIAAWTRCLQVRSGFETCEERLARWTMR